MFRLLRRIGPVVVPVLLSIADALLVNGLEMALELGVSVVAAAALLLRRRWPLLVFLVTLPGLYIGYIWFAPMIALYTLAASPLLGSARTGGTPARVRARLGVCALLLVAAHFLPYPISDFEPTAYRENTLVLIDACVTSAAPIALGLLVRTRRELASRVEDLTRSLRREDRLLAERVKATERARLAREMHDVVAHQVSLISLQAGAVQVSTADETARDGARTIRELSVRTLEELRHMVGVLRAAGGDVQDTGELAPQPSLDELPRLIEMSALDVTYEGPAAVDDDGGAGSGPGRPRGARTVERAAFRTVQEALTNVRKHAPGARVRVWVDAVELGAPGGAGAAERAREGLRVEIRNGPPDATVPVPALPGGGHGLVGLRERAQSLGGTLEARPTSEGGFVVRAEFPYGAG
ncbi:MULTISPECIES: histidine kinase [unclassified Streptomyces]|uniref:sensor histidine kinase n=1 Tax=Streptomyces sp. SID8354 TaxID=2690339 RepID=UPI000688EC8E|nr:MULTISPECIES: histidine kinase [unclassified Streptomyces]MYT33218.1 two-component sensor histidine kinase [Streptomyces sp. SID8354]